MAAFDIGGGVVIEATVSGSGPPLVLMHGAEGSHRMFDAIAPHLAKAFTVIAYDQRDCGGTHNPDSAALLADLADDAAGLLRTLGHSSAHVYGTSFGGRVAQVFAHRHDRAVTSLVLGSTWPLPARLEDLNPVTVARIVELRDRLPETAEALVPYFLPDAFLEQRPELRSLFRNAPVRSQRTARRFRSVADTPLLEPSALRVPTLCIAGALDRVVPPAVTKALAHAIPGARLIVLDDVGHAGVLQAPETIARHIESFCLQEFPPRQPPRSPT